MRNVVERLDTVWHFATLEPPFSSRIYPLKIWALKTNAAGCDSRAGLYSSSFQWYTIRVRRAGGPPKHQCGKMPHYVKSRNLEERDIVRSDRPVGSQRKNNVEASLRPAQGGFE